MTRDDNLRAKVAEQLTARSAVGGPLDRDAAECTERRYATDVGRVALHKHIVDRYLARENPRRDGRSAIITAGAPGSGKSSMLRAWVADLGDYRLIDADIIKDYLIKKALDDEIRRICVSRKENVAIEGMLTWDGQGPRIFREPASSEYIDIEVYGIDIGSAAAHEQALSRWVAGLARLGQRRR